jgi:signal transduction histidine kinase
MTSCIAAMRAGRLEPAMQQHALDVMERSVQAQSALVEDLLDLARIAAGKRRIEREPVDLAAIVLGTLDAHRFVAVQQGVALEGCSLGEPVVVYGDARLLRQLAANLLANALKFTPAGGVVRVGLVADAATVALEVRDTGAGIDPELLPHVFERFRQAASECASGRRGLGLGLTIAKCLVEALGGSISAASEGRGRGALFRVTLPRNVEPR